MSEPNIEVHVRAIASTSGGYAVFLGNEEKVFMMVIDAAVGAAVLMSIAGTQMERPLTHDLLMKILQALGTKVERAVVNDLENGTLVLNAQNELQEKIVEIDARPGDCIALALRQTAPIYVSLDVWNEVEDMTEELRRLLERNPEEDDKR
jgi:Uncharacterized conserved protein